MSIADTSSIPRHSLLEDAWAILLGTALMAFSVTILEQAGLVTGQIAGLSLILSYLTPASFGMAFFVLNLPFYILALHRMGWVFTLKTFSAVTLAALFSQFFGATITIALPVWLAALLAGGIAGTAMLVLFRHGASLGGVGIVALYLQDKIGFKAGNTQLIVDAGVFTLAALVLPPEVAMWSLLGAAVLNIIIAINHRRDRYIAY